MAVGHRGHRVRVRLSVDADELPEADEAVRAALGALRMDAVASDEPSFDVFVGVYGERYGPIDPATGISRLERDYLTAGSRPRLVYVLPGPSGRDAHLGLLLSRIQADDLTSYRRVSSAAELAELVADDLAVLLTEAFTGDMPPVPDVGQGQPTPAEAAASADRRRPAARSRIPAPWHRLIGRDADVAGVRALLAGRCRLLTLVGPGGIGKSRLAIEVASLAQDDYLDGAWFVDFAGVHDPALLAPTIAHALGVRESAGTAPVESLKAYVAPMHALLLLDSFETVSAAATLVVDLLSAAPDVQVLVTSRGTLRVRGEQEYALAALAVPPPGTTDADEGGPALELFLERAGAANPGRRLAPTERAAAAEICRRLDGVPLALELAAARTRVLPPTVLLTRLSRALDELTNGPVDLPERQRTLRTTIDWDYQLLGVEEQLVFRRLSAFPRQFTLAAAEAVVGEPGTDVMDGLDALAGKSLLRRLEPGADGEPAFIMLQAVHDYAAERLEESGETDAYQGRLARHVLDRIEQAHAAAPAEAEGWLPVLEDEHSDIRAALGYADRTVDVDLLTRLAAGLGPFWRAHCHFSEGRRWLERALALSGGQHTPTRVGLLNAAAYLCRARGDYASAESLYREGLAIREELGDKAATAGSMRFLGNVAYDRGDLDEADRWWHLSLETLEGTGDERRRMSVLNNLGVVAHHRGDDEEAIRRFDETYELGLTIGSSEHRARGRMNKAMALVPLGRLDEAVACARQAVAIYAELDDTWDLVDALDVLAGAVGGSGRTRLSGWLYGGAGSLRLALDVRRPMSEQHDFDENVARSRDKDPAVFDAARAEGATASLQEIVRTALDEESP